MKKHTHNNSIFHFSWVKRTYHQAWPKQLHEARDVELTSPTSAASGDLGDSWAAVDGVCHEKWVDGFAYGDLMVI